MTFPPNYYKPRPPDWHVRLGLALGYPRCCVEAFAAHLSAAVTHGSICLGRRTEVPQIVRDYGMENIIRVGSPVTYVPCSDCVANHPNWQPFDAGLHPAEREAAAEGIA